MSIAVSKSEVENSGEQYTGEPNQIENNITENIAPFVPFIKECKMCHSIWDYFSGMTECPKCGTKFQAV
ncbi:hypothetical protein DEAC_c02620 [Desulfosporosinus acididurans]|uniref:Uncharacterized protein n=1 Tax=Desulfosporosinus acididurans TaxID=476652 RepID=A0A0J1FWT4_9FIRM|nr:hypothetical protein DEAC_c02620 [Desulfosporosinus acididurans]